MTIDGVLITWIIYPTLKSRWGKYIFKLSLVKYQFKGILGKMSTKYLDVIIWSESVWRCLGWCYKKSDQLQEEMSDSYFSNSIRRSCWMGMWAGKINSGEANNAGDRWVLFAILLTLAGKKGPRLNRLWFQSLGRRECCGNLFTMSQKNISRYLYLSSWSQIDSTNSLFLCWNLFCV